MTSAISSMEDLRTHVGIIPSLDEPPVEDAEIVKEPEPDPRTAPELAAALDEPDHR